MIDVPLRVGLGALASFALAVTAVGCSDASGQVVGGQPILLSSPPPASTSDSGMQTSPLPVECQPGGANAGNTWTDLYTCYFGPTSLGNCAGSPGGCHASLQDPGGLVSGFQCPPDVASCYAGIVGATSIVPMGGATDATTTTLYQALRMSDGTCSAGACMPLSPLSVVFEASDFARISAWITGGAPQN